MEQQEKDVICADEKTQEKRNNTKPRAIPSAKYV